MTRGSSISVGDVARGIGSNLSQFVHQLVQVLLVGLALGMMRTVVPALAETEFGVARGSMILLGTFVVAFGVVKAVLNFVAGRMSERVGRRRVLLLGWVAALPVPFMIYFAPDWNWIVAATVMLGVNQGLAWSMTQTAKLDIARADQRGVTIGLNEFAGYAGVALAGIVTAYLAASIGARSGLLAFGLVVVLTGLALTLLWVKETLSGAGVQSPVRDRRAGHAHPTEKAVESPSLGQAFALMSWRDRRLAAISQAGHVEKFVDALVWIVLPVFLLRKGLELPVIGWIVGTYGFTWGISQLVTGPLSDRVGRHRLNVAGMWICGGGVGMFVLLDGTLWWALSAAVSGLGMALLYPNLSAAVADIAPVAWRGTAIGIYRFWRDLGYAVGALGIGLAVTLAGSLEAAFCFVAATMMASGALLMAYGGESHIPTVVDPSRV